MDTSAVLLGTTLAIMGFVNLAKKFGLSNNWAAVLAVVLGVTFSTTDYLFLGGMQTPAGVYGALAAGALMGLSATGLYDATKAIGTNVVINGTGKRYVDDEEPA